MRGWMGLGMAMLVCASTSTAWALPSEQSLSATDADATIRLRVLSEHVRNDTRSWCDVRITVAGTETVFTAGDRIYLWVYEDDVVGDEELWATDFVISGAEVSAQRVDRTFDCSSDFGNDASATLELYAEARIEKASCGAFCTWDRPETSLLDLAERDDDSAEMDDTRGTAAPISSGTPVARIGVDTDFHAITLGGPATLEVTAFFRPNAGLMNVDLMDDTGSVIVSGSDGTNGSSATSGALAAGTYYVRVVPRAPPDYQFYDLLVTATTTSCGAGATEMRDCGICGTQSRACSGGSWGGWGACMGEGECAPDATESRSCGSGGTQTRRCDATCDWGDYGTCMGSSSDAGVTPTPVDAGAVDAGMVDAGSTPIPASDASLTDGGVSPSIDGGGTAAPLTGGCACRATRQRDVAPLPFALVVVGIAAAWRRRRR